MGAGRPPLVAHVIFRLAVGGLENGLINLINRIPDREFRHAIVCIDGFTDFRKRIDRDDVEIIAINKKPGTDAAALVRLYKEFRRLQPSVVHTRNIAALDALLPALLAGVKVRIHGEHGWDIGDVDGGSAKHRFLRRVHAPLIKRYVTVSKHLESYLTKDVGIDRARVSQIYNGVDTSKYRPAHPGERQHLPLRQKFGETAVLIGTVGRLNPVKDQMSLVEAFVRLLQRYPEMRETVRLVVVGDGPVRDRIQGRVTAAGLEDLAWIPGSRDDVSQILRSLDVFVLPSLAEGVSNTILEAMASGVPVVATAVGGNVELVEDGLTGSLVAPADSAALSDAIADYVRSPDRRRRHGLAARGVAEEKFGIAQMVDAYRTTYQNLLS